MFMHLTNITMKQCKFCSLILDINAIELDNPIPKNALRKMVADVQMLDDLSQKLSIRRIH